MYRLGIVTSKGRMFAQKSDPPQPHKPFYIGTIVWDGKEYPGKQPHLISDEHFAAVQAKIKRNRPVKYHKHNPLLKGIVICEHCGRNVTWQLKRVRCMDPANENSKPVNSRSLFVKTQCSALSKTPRDLVCPSQDVINWLTTLLKEDFKLSIHRTLRLRSMRLMNV